jgi:hypothetical protein
MKPDMSTWTGTNPNDGLGDPIRNIFNDIKVITNELYDFKNRMLDTSAKILTDSDDMYAHEGHYTIYRGISKTILIFIYTSNKVAGEGGSLDWTMRLKFYEFPQMGSALRVIDIFDAGVGVVPSSLYVLAPRVHIFGTTLRCFMGSDAGVIARDIAIIGDDPDDWTYGDSYILEMTMKDAGGNNVKVDCTPANIQTHLEYTLGDTYAGYNNTVLTIRNFGVVSSYGGVMYSILEATAEYNTPAYGRIAMVIESTDSGENWTITHMVNYTTSNRRTLTESSLVFVGSVMHVISRLNSGLVEHNVSTDQGATWATAVNLPLPTIETKPCAINYVNAAGATRVMLVVNETSEVAGDTTRTTMVIYDTDFVTYNEVARIVRYAQVHYPGLYYYGRSMYLCYTGGGNYQSSLNGSWSKSMIMFTKVF